MPRFKQIGIDVEVNGFIEKNRKAFSESENEILRRILRLPSGESRRQPVIAKPPSTESGPVRQRGNWTVRIRDSRLGAPNLKESYRLLLLELHKLNPTFLEEFSLEKSRSRRFVSRSPEKLYLSSPQLAKEYAQPLVDGWYFDTNLSTQQVSQRIRIAARLCALNYGREVQILNRFEEI